MIFNYQGERLKENVEELVGEIKDEYDAETEPIALDATRALCASLPIAVAEPWDAMVRAMPGSSSSSQISNTRA